MLAFVTFYGLLVVVFTCLYRIADLTMPVPQFSLHGSPARISFVDALYYSAVTITTLGIGDISPVSMLVRALTALEVVSGVLMLLFGFSEIMRSAAPTVTPRRVRPPAHRSRTRSSPIAVLPRCSRHNLCAPGGSAWVGRVAEFWSPAGRGSSAPISAMRWRNVARA